MADEEITRLKARVHQIEQERERLDAELDLYKDSLMLCAFHTPDRWEGDGSCVICEAIHLNDRHKAAESRVSHLAQENETLRRLAKEATNGWACYAKRKIEHEDIARLHREIDAIPALAPRTDGPATTHRSG